MRPLATIVSALLLLPGAARAAPASPSVSPTRDAAKAMLLPPSPLAMRKIALGDELSAKGDLRGALFAYQDAAALDATSAEARMKLGDTYERLGHAPEAIRQWEYAVLFAPPNELARAKIERARAGPSLPAAGGAPADADAGTPARTSYEAGVALIGKALYAEALASLDEAVRLDPKLAFAYAARASARFGLGKYAASADDYRAALALDDTLATPLYGLAECHRMLKQPEAAARYYAAYAGSGAADVREELRAEALRRGAELAANR
jgi:tetratricopeptide (TPR) repeat protein